MGRITLSNVGSVLRMIKERVRNFPVYGYIGIKSKTISASRSILERASLFEGYTPMKTSSSISTREKVAKKGCDKK